MKKAELTTEIPADAKPVLVAGWISVNEKMPQHKQEVLANLNYAGSPPVCQCTFVERYCNEKVDWQNVFVGLNGGLYPHQGVAHWMPLPSPPACH
jgi:hypothetical protein